MPLCRCRRERRLLFHREQKGTGSDRERGRAVRARSVRFSSTITHLFRTDRPAAERFVPPRRRRRGLRVGSARSRGGKPPLIAPKPATLVKIPDVRVARKAKREVREALFADNTSDKLYGFVRKYRASTGTRRKELKDRCFMLYRSFCGFIGRFRSLPPPIPFHQWVHSGRYHTRKMVDGSAVLRAPPGRVSYDSSELDAVLEALGFGDPPGPLSSVPPPPQLTVKKRGRVFRGPGGVMMRDFGSYVSPLGVDEVGPSRRRRPG